jgi:hypothetical protein
MSTDKTFEREHESEGSTIWHDLIAQLVGKSGLHRNGAGASSKDNLEK